MTDTMRAEFEAWVKESTGTIFSPGGAKHSILYFLIWQAGHAAGLKRAAEVCRQWAEQHRIDANELRYEHCDFRIGAGDCVAAIEREMQSDPVK